MPLRLLVREILSKRSQIKLDELTPSDKAYLLAWEEADKERLNNPDLKELDEANYKDALESLWRGAEEEIRGAKTDRFPSLKAAERNRASLQSWLRTYEETLLTDVGTFASKQHNSLRDFISDCQNDLVGTGYRLPSNLGSWGEKFLQDYVKIQGYIVRCKIDLLDHQRDNLFLHPRNDTENSNVKDQSILGRTPLFSSVYKEFIDIKINNGLDDKILRQYDRNYRDWNELLDDKSIGDYTKKDLKNFIQSYKGLPKRTLREYKDKSITELMDLDVSEKDQLKPKTVREVRKWLLGVFSHAIEEDYISESPARGIKLGLEDSLSFAKYSDHEIGLFFDNLNDVKQWQKWVVLIAAYTGMRRGEIIQLRNEDFRFDTDSGRNYILATDLDPSQSLKTKAAKRQIPIHPELIERGILNLVKNSTSEIFPDVKINRVTDWFSNTYRDVCGVGKYDDLGRRKVFHSFRHTVITKLLGAGANPAQVQQIVGHEKTSLGITDRYTHEFSIKELATVIDKLDYSS